MPVTAFGETVKGTCDGVLETATLRGQTVLGGTEGRCGGGRIVQESDLGIPERNRVALTYWLRVMFGRVREKRCLFARRISDVIAGLRLTVVEVPEDVVNLIDAIVT